MFEGIKTHWANFKKYWDRNLQENYKAVSKAFGSLLIVLVSAAVPQVISFINGSGFNWGVYLSVVLGTLGLFWAVLITSIFGKSDEQEEDNE